MAGTLTISTLSDGTNSTSSTNCIQGSAKAWVNFNGTTSPGTIRASYNVGSVTKNGTGDYTVNFATAMPDANYAVLAMAGGFGSNNAAIGFYESGSTARTASSVRIFSSQGATAVDGSFESVAIFR